MDHHRYYRIADITIRVESELPITNRTFSKTLELFRVDGPGADTVTIHHHFSLPNLKGQNIGREVYRKAPWAIHQQEDGWLYLGILPDDPDQELWTVAKYNRDHSIGHIYHPDDEAFQNGNLEALTMFPSDQILIARLLAERQGCYLHSSGAIMNGFGILFVGHSEAGKTTTTRMLMDAAASSPSRIQVEILCDDRNIVRHRQEGWHVYGTWSHGDIPDVSPASAPLRMICFLEQADENTLTHLPDRQEITRRLLACVIKPFETAEWWHKTLDLISQIAGAVPCYAMRFDKSGVIVEELVRMVTAESLS